MVLSASASALSPPDTSRGLAVELTRVTKAYDTPDGSLEVLRRADLAIEPAQLVAIVGRSGSGKSTLLNLISAIDRPTSGRISVNGTSVGGLDERAAARFRGVAIGIVFQFFQLLPTLSLIDNVALPMELAGRWPPPARRERARWLLDRVGLATAADRYPAAVSGGQQQRAAIARALANDPPIIVADEPTGNLDPATAAEIGSLLRDLADGGTTVVIVSHDARVAELADRVVRLSNGRLVEEPAR
jgi:putative ABC transport system ATP-binding protein